MSSSNSGDRVWLVSRVCYLHVAMKNICLIDSWYLPCIDAIPKRAEIHSGSGWLTPNSQRTKR
jgi:hypothetical protein